MLLYGWNEEQREILRMPIIDIQKRTAKIASVEKGGGREKFTLMLNKLWCEAHQQPHTTADLTLFPSLPQIQSHAALPQSPQSPPSDIAATHHSIGWQFLVPWSEMPRTNGAWGKGPLAMENHWGRES